MSGLFASTYADDVLAAEIYQWQEHQRQNPKFAELSEISKRHHLSLSGTAAATIMGNNPYDNADDLIARMNFELPDKEQTFAMARGTALEDPIRQFAVSKLKLQNVKADLDFASPADPERKDETWFTCQIDTIGTLAGGEQAILEIKTAGRNLKTKGRHWGKGCKINDNGALLTVDSTIPTNYLCQVQFQMNLSGIHKAFVAVMIDGDAEPRIFCVPYDAEMADQICSSMTAFLVEHVIPNRKINAVQEVKPAALPTEQTCASAIDFAHFKNTELEKTYIEFLRANSALEEMKKRADDLKAKLRGGIGEFKQVLDPQGRPFITVSTYERSTFDSRRFGNDEPELYKKYLKTTACERFTVKEVEYEH